MRKLNADWGVQPIHSLTVDVEEARPSIWWTFEPYNLPDGDPANQVIGYSVTPGGHAVPLPPSQQASDPIPYIP